MTAFFASFRWLCWLLPFVKFHTSSTAGAVPLLLKGEGMIWFKFLTIDKNPKP
jgi:hypothetical protein